VQLGLTLGYWGAAPPPDALEKVLEAERLGFSAVFTAESWGSDAFGPLAWWGSRTERIRLGTSIVQISARTPTSCAMHALTLDHLSGGRFVLGLGVSGPQVVEGWYGAPFGRPLARTREYVGIIRQVLAREGPVTSPGPHHPLPFDGPGAVGLGKPLKSITHPIRRELPILLGAEGPKNIALAAEIADGWLPIYYSPTVASTYRGWLEEGFARAGEPGKAARFEIAPNCSVVVTDDVDGALDAMRPTLGFYIGGMGAPHMNFHKQVFARMGYEAEANRIQELFLAGRRDDAIAAVPARMAADISLVGPPGKIRDELPMWEEAGVTMLVVGARSTQEMRQVAEVVLGA
jgi:F420-dependent oxidoreductase-like protein